ncbi:MAG: hypothetical protein WC686_00280 [Candidatus Shapirobacteria bacterium]|jgi:hypothetical protein
MEQLELSLILGFVPGAILGLLATTQSYPQWKIDGFALPKSNKEKVLRLTKSYPKITKAWNTYGNWVTILMGLVLAAIGIVLKLDKIYIAVICFSLIIGLMGTVYLAAFLIDGRLRTRR